MQFTSATLCGNDICLGNTECKYNKASESIECFCLEGYFKVPDDKGIRCEKEAIHAIGIDLETVDDRENLENFIGNENKFFGVDIVDSENNKHQNCTKGTKCLKTNESNSQEQIDSKENLLKSTTRSPDIEINKENILTAVKSNNSNEDTIVDLKESTSEKIVPILNDNEEFKLRVSDVNCDENDHNCKKSLLDSSTEKPLNDSVPNQENNEILDDKVEETSSEKTELDEIENLVEIIDEIDISTAKTKICDHEHPCLDDVRESSSQPTTTIQNDQFKTLPNTDIFLGLFDFDVDIVKCGKDEFLCRQKCCKNQNQLCNKLGECIEKIYDDSKAEKTKIVLNDSGELNEIENLGEINDEIDISTAKTKICNHENPCLDDVTESSSQPTNTIQNEQFKTLLNTDIFLGLFDFAEDIVKCGKDEFLCRQKCCKNQNQLCNKLGECIEKANTNVASLPYTIIGSVCIVTALGFILYKVYKFKQTGEF